MNIVSFANMLLVDKNNAFVMSLFYIRNFFFMFTLKKKPSPNFVLTYIHLTQLDGIRRYGTKFYRGTIITILNLLSSRSLLCKVTARERI